jgi:polysaccharide biosynthesis/export protein
MRFIKTLLLLALLPMLLNSCYNKSVMFKTNVEYYGDTLKQKVLDAEKTYSIHPNDYITYTIYTNNGERLIDPNFEIRKATGVVSVNETPKYLVNADGTVSFPMVGKLSVAGLKLRQLDSLLTLKYNNFYKEVYVISKVVNKRVFVLGTASFGSNNTGAKVVPLENENMNLIEVITIAGGLDNLSKAHNIRLIRGDLKNPTVMIIDLSTIDGLKKANLIVQPNDIIYIERFQRKFSQSLNESAGAISILSTILLLVITVITIKK